MPDAGLDLDLDHETGAHLAQFTVAFLCLWRWRWVLP